MDLLWIIVLIVAISFIYILFKNKRKGLFEIEIPNILVASNERSGSIRIKPLYEFSEDTAYIDAYIQNDHGEVYQLELTRNEKYFDAEIVLQVSGEYILHVVRKETNSTENHQIEIMPSTPVDMITDDIPLDMYKPDKGILITAMVTDEFDNVLPKDKLDIQFASDDGTFSEYDVGVSKTGIIFNSKQPISSSITITENNSGIQKKLDVLIPEVALRGSDTAIIHEGKDTLFPVHLYLRLDSGENLRTFNLELMLNELTVFHHFNPDAQIDLPTKPEISVTDKKVSISCEYIDPALNTKEAYIYIGEYWFECLGEGESLIEVEKVEYTVSSSPDQQRGGRPEHWERHGCLNKRRIKKLCINPIVLGNSWRKSEILRELQITQDNFDQACCKITIEVNNIPIENLTQNNIVTKRINGIRNSDRFIDDPGIISQKSSITTLAEKIFTRHKDKRKSECLNVYFARSIFRGFLWKTIGGVRKRHIINGLNGATIVPHILNKDGENINNIRWKDSSGKTIGQDSQLKIQDITSVFISRFGIGKKTLKHEIGHALGLRYANEYKNNARLRRPTKNRIMWFGPAKGSKFSKLECEKMMTNINGFLKDY